MRAFNNFLRPVPNHDVNICTLDLFYDTFVVGCVTYHNEARMLLGYSTVYGLNDEHQHCVRRHLSDRLRAVGPGRGGEPQTRSNETRVGKVPPSASPRSRYPKLASLSSSDFSISSSAAIVACFLCLAVYILFSSRSLLVHPPSSSKAQGSDTMVSTAIALQILVQ